MDLEFNKNEDSMLLLLSERQRKLNQIEKGGGEKSMEKQHAQGKMTARERVDYLVDDPEDSSPLRSSE